jgi:putative IMPACT (imprinted ancient) family translation regulator
LFKSEYFDARHHCFAWMLDLKRMLCIDDGEPNHSAGDPILDKFVQEISPPQGVLFVTGTKLGVGGLIAYMCSCQMYLKV